LADAARVFKRRLFVGYRLLPATVLEVGFLARHSALAAFLAAVALAVVFLAVVLVVVFLAVVLAVVFLAAVLAVVFFAVVLAVDLVVAFLAVVFLSDAELFKAPFLSAAAALLLGRGTETLKPKVGGFLPVSASLGLVGQSTFGHNNWPLVAVLSDSTW
jgi:hypothetical protein